MISYVHISIHIYFHIYATRQNTSTRNVTMILNLTEMLGTWNFLQSSYNIYLLSYGLNKPYILIS